MGTHTVSPVLSADMRRGISEYGSGSAELSAQVSAPILSKKARSSGVESDLRAAYSGSRIGNSYTLPVFMSRVATMSE